MTEPTDAEIVDCIRSAKLRCVHPDAATTIEIARAVLARWGQPSGAVDWIGASSHHLIQQPTQAVPPAGREPLTEVQIERAAKKLAECMDYPWGHMPTIGREEMRIHARAVLEAARMEKAP